MEITNRNTFTDEEVFFDKEKGLVYIGKACYSIKDLETIVLKSRMKDFNESLNYRVSNYGKSRTF